jgi:BlaR1 peptidase M56
MILYLIKSGGCLLALLTIYNLILEKEKMLRFNRLWLLFSLIFSFILPVLTLPIPHPYMPAAETFSLLTGSHPESTSSASHFTPSPKPVPVLTMATFLAIVYGGVTLFLLGRFLRNLYLILGRIAVHPHVRLSRARLVLLSEEYVPHTFGNAIFVNEAAYRNHQIDKEILTHELTHVQQRHTLDILLIETLRIFFWFNPILILYKRAIALNHEFLADEAVIGAYHNPKEYQHLLFQLVSLANPSVLSSPLNYNITKKRLIMISQNTPQHGWVKKLATLPFLLGAIILFSTSIQAQQTDSIRYPDRTVRGTENLGANPYVVIDEKSYPADILTKISPACIGSTTIFGDKKAAERKYGPAAADGAVILTLQKTGITYATDIDRENLRLERSASNRFYTRLQLKNEDGSDADEIVVNWPKGSRATATSIRDCKVAFLIDGHVYKEDQLDEVQTRIKNMPPKSTSGVTVDDKQTSNPVLAGYNVVFWFSSPKN